MINPLFCMLSKSENFNFNLKKKTLSLSSHLTKLTITTFYARLVLIEMELENNTLKSVKNCSYEWGEYFLTHFKRGKQFKIDCIAMNEQKLLTQKKPKTNIS